MRSGILQKDTLREYAPVLALLAIFFILVLTSVNTKSPVCDEASHHIASGYSFVKLHDFRMNPSAPPLLRILMGLPLLPLDLKIPIAHPSWFAVNSSDFSYQFLFVYNRITDKVVFLSRLPMIALSTILGFFIFFWTRILYGYRAGLFALFLYVFSPTMLGNAGLAMLDMGSSLFIFIATFQFWRYLKDKSALNLALSGVALGLALSSKHTALILLVLFFAFVLIDIMMRNKKENSSFFRAAARFLYISLIAFFVLWGTYFFEYKPLLKNAPDIGEKIECIKKFAGIVPGVDHEKLSNFLVRCAEDVPVPLSTYAVSFLGVARMVAIPVQPLFFLGHEFFGGSKIYYIVDYLIKTPIPEIIFLVISLLLISKRTRIDSLTALVLIAPIVTFFGIASFSKLQGGLRYILPFYPFLFVILGDIVNIDLGKATKKFKILITCLSAWYLLSSLITYPDYLAYFNESVGGVRGFGYKITADMDWGQDFKALKKYLDKEGIATVRLYCFGSVDPSYYGIRYEKLHKDEFEKPVGGSYYAISARYLPDVKWAGSMVPMARVGGTIFVYHISADRR